MAISANSKILASDVSGAVKSFSVSGKTVTYTTLGGATGTFTTQDTNTTYSAFTKATSSAAGTAGLVPAPAAGAQAKFLRGDATWQTIASVATKAYISETWKSGTSWYRKWSDGWIEQGGRVGARSDRNFVVTFPTAFSNTNFTITYGPATSSAGNGSQSDRIVWSTLKKTGFTYQRTDSNATYAPWYACGY